MGQKIAYSCSDGSLSLGLVVPKMSLQRCFNYLDISDWFSNQISLYPVHPRLCVINSIKENCGGGCGYRIGTLSVVRITGLNENKWCSWCGSVQFCSGHQTQSGFVILLASKWEPFRLWFAIHPSSSESPLDLIQHIIMRVRLHGSTEWMTDWLTGWLIDEWWWCGGWRSMTGRIIRMWIEWNCDESPIKGGKSIPLSMWSLHYHLRIIQLSMQ